MTRRASGAESPTTIDIKKAYPGDIFLTAANTRTSKAIRQLTGSRYSHAVLYLGAGLVIESAPDDGIAFGAITLIKAESDHSKREYRVFGKVPGAQTLHVYRHKALAGVSETLEQSLSRMVELHRIALNHWGKDYSRLEQLGDASQVLARLPRLKRWILTRVGKLGPDDGKEVPGAFCSQFVAEVLAEAGLPPFSVNLRSDHASPQSLADPKISNLVRQQEPERAPDPSKLCDEQELENQRLVIRSSVGLGMNRYRKGQLHQSKALEELDALLQNHLKRAREVLRKLGGSGTP